jgi:hypothetical protein
LPRSFFEGVDVAGANDADDRANHGFSDCATGSCQRRCSYFFFSVADDARCHDPFFAPTILMLGPTRVFSDRQYASADATRVFSDRHHARTDDDTPTAAIAPMVVLILCVLMLSLFVSSQCDRGKNGRDAIALSSKFIFNNINSHLIRNITNQWPLLQKSNS